MRVTRDQWFAVGAAIAMLVIFALIVWLPQQRSLDRLNDQQGQLRAAMEVDAANVACVPAMAQQVQVMRRQLAGFDRRLPQQQELAGFLKEISSTVVAQRLDDQVIQPGSPTQGELYNCLPIIMRFTADFEALKGFLCKLNEMERLNRIERISVKPATDDVGKLSVELQMNIYFTEG